MAVRSAREAAYETIRSRIITMELKPGDELNDHELAQELGISRTPMREALIMLNIAHMVTIKPQSGTYVAPIDLELMEIVCALHAGKRASEPDPGPPDRRAGESLPAADRAVPCAGKPPGGREPRDPDAGSGQRLPPPRL